MNKVLLFGICLLFTLNIFSQQHPPKLKWIKLETPHFNVIAPIELSKQLNETAHLLEFVYPPVSKSLIEPKKKLNIFLFNQSTRSNGYVAMAPTYSAYYHTPFQDANAVGGADWFQTLAVHEYRHYVQFDKLNSGFNYIAKSVLGDMGQAIFMNLSVPAWFFEGDAVCSETALTTGGRGRLPAFTRDIRALELENTRYNYNKAYLGSYKDYFPNHYHLGYIMSSGIRKQYGVEAWNNVISRSARKSFWPWSFSRSLNKYAGGIVTTSYKQVLNEYDSIWTAQEKKHLTTNFNSVKPKRKVYTNYKYPFKINNEETICLKTGLATPPKLTLISEGKERELLQIDPIDRVHSNGKLVVWASYKSDVRWEQKAFTYIMVYNIQTQELKKITEKQKYFAPAISPSGEKIAVVEYTESMECSIIIISAENGSIIQKYPIQHPYFVRMPSWSEDEDQLVFTETNGQNISISTLDLKTSETKEKVAASPLNLTSPIFLKDFIVYNSPEIGVDAIVALDTLTKQIFVVASSNYGVYQASLSPDKSTLSFQDYSTKGFNIGQSEVYPKEWLGISEFQNVHDKYYQHIVDQEESGNIFEDYEPDSTHYFKNKRYNSFLHSIKVHSWLPYPVNKGLGFRVISNDFLNTTTASAGIEYHPNYYTSRGYLNISYAKFYPIFDAEISYGRMYEPFEDTLNNTSTTGLNEKAIILGVRVPLNLSRRVWQTKLNFNTSYNYIDQNFTEAKPDYAITPDNYQFSAVNLGMEFTNYRQSSLRDIKPRYGQELKINTWLTPFDDITNGSRISTAGKLYFPGFLNHHSLEFEAAYENNSEDFRGGVYTQATDIEFVRGYLKPIANYYYNAKAIYTLPLFYPDLSLGPIAYIKRIYASTFYDFGRTYTTATDVTNYYNVVGLDFNFDFHIIRLLQVPLSLGIRLSYLMEKDEFMTEVLFLGVAF